MGEAIHCEVPSEEARSRLDQLALGLRDALRLPGAEPLSATYQEHVPGEQVWVLWMGVVVDSPWGSREHRIFTAEPELASEMARVLEEVCGLG